MRTLASVVRIDDVSILENSDTLSVAKVGGWDVVVKRDEYKAGDLAIYFEIDSFLPDIEEFAFLGNSSKKTLNNKQGFRLRTIKLRGQVSQGLLVGLSLLNRFGSLDGDVFTMSAEGLSVAQVTIAEGLDLTDVIGVVKYEPELSSGNVRQEGCFPSFIIKTDETRIQDPKMLKKVLEYQQNTVNAIWYATSKLDGSSITIYKRDDHVGVCSRNWELKDEQGNQFWETARDEGLVDFVTNFPKNIALQGELVGPGIQKNRLSLTKKYVYVFSAFDIDTFKYYTGDELLSLAEEYNIRLVPMIYQGVIPEDKQNLLDFCEEKADRHSPVAINELQEGAVFRPMYNSDLSFKFISSTYLLKHGI